MRVIEAKTFSGFGGLQPRACTQPSDSSFSTLKSNQKLNLFTLVLEFDPKQSQRRPVLL
jgi:hypothetical protein